MKVGECENEDTDGKTHHDDKWDVVVVVTDARDANQWHEINVDKGKARDELVPFLGPLHFQHVWKARINLGKRYVDTDDA